MSQLCMENILVEASGRTILQIKSLQIERGHFVGIAGPNGAGKTTLLKLVCGLQKARRGKVTIDGESVTGMSGLAKTHLCRLIGYVPQQAEYNSDVPFTVLEVVAMGRTAGKPLFSRLNKDDYEYSQYWIDRLGLHAQGRQTFRSLSGGEQQKALIARAMAADPQILLLDEPTANLDFRWKRQLMDVLEMVYSQTSVTVLMVSHEISSWPSACKRVLFVNEGTIIADGTPEDISFEKYFEQSQIRVGFDA